MISHVKIKDYNQNYLIFLRMDGNVKVLKINVYYFFIKHLVNQHQMKLKVRQHQINYEMIYHNRSSL